MPIESPVSDPAELTDKAKRALEGVAAKGKASLKAAEDKAHDLAVVSKKKGQAAAAKAGAEVKAHPVAAALAVIGIAGVAFMFLNGKGRTRVAKGAGAALGFAKRKSLDSAGDVADWAKRTTKKLRSAA